MTTPPSRIMPEMTKILIVEDEAYLNKAFQIVLEKNGYKVETCFDGKEALEKAETFKPDLILLDILMPNMNGKEFLKKYDIQNTHKNVKILVLSNLETKDDTDDTYKLGAHKYFVKSLASPQMLVKLVEQTLAGK